MEVSFAGRDVFMHVAVILAASVLVQGRVLRYTPCVVSEPTCQVVWQTPLADPDGLAEALRMLTELTGSEPELHPSENQLNDLFGRLRGGVWRCTYRHNGAAQLAAMGVGLIQRSAMLAVAQRLEYRKLYSNVLHWRYSAAGFVEIDAHLALGGDPLQSSQGGTFLETYQTVGTAGEYLEVRFGYASAAKRRAHEIGWKCFSSTIIDRDCWTTREFTIARPQSLGAQEPGPQLVVESESGYEFEAGRRRRKLRCRLPPVQPVWELPREEPSWAHDKHTPWWWQRNADKAPRDTGATVAPVYQCGSRRSYSHSL